LLKLRDFYLKPAKFFSSWGRNSYVVNFSQTRYYFKSFAYVFW